MQTAVAETTTAAGTVDEQLTTRLLYQRIIVLGTEVDHPGQPGRSSWPAPATSSARPPQLGIARREAMPAGGDHAKQPELTALQRLRRSIGGGHC
jgi:hypothetical protein